MSTVVSVSTVNYRCWGWGQGSGKALMCYYLYCAPFLQKKKKEDNLTDKPQIVQ